MSTAIERLKALAAAKRAAEAKEKEDAGTQIPQAGQVNAPSNSLGAGAGTHTVSNSAGPDLHGAAKDEPAISVPAVNSPEPVSSSDHANSGQPEKKASEHPLMMELAELEQALLQQLPEFKTILKDIHGKLRQDPELVAIMSEEEIELVVRGLTKHATVEIIAPKAAKAARKSAKTPISAADL